MRYSLVWRALERRVGAAAAQAFINVSITHDIVPHWVGMAGVSTEHANKGHRKVPHLWDIILEGDLGLSLGREWQRRTCGIYPLALESDPDGKAPMKWGDATGWGNLLADADDLLQPAKSEDELRQMYRVFIAACK